jgi:hypothetical protein
MLNPCQRLRPFVQRQTQVGDILETIGTVELHDAGTERLTIDPGSNQSKSPPIRDPPLSGYIPADRIAPVVIPQSPDSLRATGMLETLLNSYESPLPAVAYTKRPKD